MVTAFVDTVEVELYLNGSIGDSWGDVTSRIEAPEIEPDNLVYLTFVGFDNIDVIKNVEIEHSSASSDNIKLELEINHKLPQGSEARLSTISLINRTMDTETVMLSDVLTSRAREVGGYIEQPSSISLSSSISHTGGGSTLRTTVNDEIIATIDVQVIGRIP